MRKLHAIATATAMLALCTSGAATAQEKVLRVMNSGGSYGDSIEECVNKPLMEQAGIKVVQESPGGFAKLQAQGRSGVIANTTTDASTGDLLRMVAADLVEPMFRTFSATDSERRLSAAVRPDPRRRAACRSAPTT